MPDRPLRVLELFQPPAGGVPVYVAHLARGLTSRGHHVVVAGPPNAAIRGEIEDAGVRYLPLAISPELRPRQDLRLLRRLVALLRTGNFDAMHAHAQKAGLVGRLAGMIARVPVLYTANCFTYRTQLLKARPSARVRYVAAKAMERLLGRIAGGIIAVADEERQAALDDRLARPERVHLVLTGVEVEPDVQPDPALVAFRGEGPLFGFVATLRDQKGLPVLLDALELLAARGGAPRVAIVGNGPLWGEVQQRLAAGSLGQTTLLVPFEDRSEPYLAALDALVLPSLWEGLPLAVLEAMFLGVPVVATAVGGTAEAVRHERTGLIVPPGDALALADAMARMAVDPDLRERMGSAARQEAEQRFTVDRMVRETEAVLVGL